METQVIALVTVLVYTCVTLAHPVNHRQEDLKHLVSILGKFNDMDSSNNAAISRPATGIDTGKNRFPEGIDVKAALEEDLLTKGLLERSAAGGLMAKRQGDWTYDYGLGGGRYGKRNYGDYGIGGGRFGRDVDHVDLSDANDQDSS